MSNIMITGASRGLGYELVKLFYSHGATVFPLVRTQAAADILLAECRTRVVPIIADVGMDECEVQIRETLFQHADCLDILLNNAGSPGQAKTIEELTTEEMAHQLNVHCLGPVRTIKAALPLLERSSHPRIVNVSSRLGSLGMMSSGEFDHLSISYSYRIAKAAQNMFTICLDQELRKKGIAVNSIHPGKLKTTSAAKDADMDVTQGAHNIYAWLQAVEKGYSGKYVQPGAGELPW